MSKVGLWCQHCGVHLGEFGADPRVWPAWCGWCGERVMPENEVIDGE
jgi:hypothetical protein